MRNLLNVVAVDNDLVLKLFVISRQLEQSVLDGQRLKSEKPDALKNSFATGLRAEIFRQVLDGINTVVAEQKWEKYSFQRDQFRSNFPFRPEFRHALQFYSLTAGKTLFSRNEIVFFAGALKRIYDLIEANPPDGEAYIDSRMDMGLYGFIMYRYAPQRHLKPLLEVEGLVTAPHLRRYSLEELGFAA